MNPFRVRAFALALLICPSVVHAQAAQCSRVAWSAPQALKTRAGRAAYLESPEVVKSGDSLIVFGSPTFAFDSILGPELSQPGNMKAIYFAGGVLSVNALRQGRGAIDLIALPDSVFTWSHLRAVDTPRGVSMLWRNTLRNDTQSDTVWTATWRAGRWTPTRAVLTARDDAMWISAFVSAAEHYGNEPRILAPLRSGRPLLMLRYADGSWHKENVQGPNGAYVAAAWPGADPSHMAIIHVSGSQDATNHVFARYSETAGKSWSSAVQLTEAGQMRSDYPQLIRVGPNRLVAAWSQMMPNGYFVRVALSADGGRSWASLPPIPADSYIEAISAMADQHGAVHLAWSESDHDGVRYATVRDGKVSAVSSIGQRRVVGRTTTVALSSREYLRMWGTVLREAPESHFPITYYAVGRCSNQ